MKKDFSIKKFTFVLTVLLAFSFLPSNNANAEWDGFTMLRDCVNTPNRPCIESIYATTANGKRIQAELTGRTISDSGVAPNNIDDEYQLNGMIFEAPAGNRFISRVFYDGTMFQTVFEASWIDHTDKTRENFVIASPRRVTNLWCGKPESPSVCYRNINFNQDLIFEQTIRVPSSFITAFVNARTDSLSYETNLNPKKIDGINYSSIRLKINVTKKAQVIFSDLLLNPLATSQWADTEIDQTIANFFTPENVNAKRLGKCSGTPSVSVISNGINPEVPYWDESSKSVNVLVSGPHFRVNGALNKGFFQARISKELGKCLWGIDLSKSTKFQISITDSDGIGVQNLETVSGVFDGKDYILAASNFHYSSPKLSFRLFEDVVNPELAAAIENVKKVESAAPIPITVIKKKTITCTKGKLTKKVTGLAPKCPAGYKKK